MGCKCAILHHLGIVQVLDSRDVKQLAQIVNITIVHKLLVGKIKLPNLLRNAGLKRAFNRVAEEIVRCVEAASGDGDVRRSRARAPVDTCTASRRVP